MVELVLIAVAALSLSLTLLLRRQVKCEVLKDSVKQEVIRNEKVEDVSVEVSTGF